MTSRGPSRIRFHLACAMQGCRNRVDRSAMCEEGWSEFCPDCEAGISYRRQVERIASEIRQQEKIRRHVKDTFIPILYRCVNARGRNIT